jgi:hypothetical protein
MMPSTETSVAHAVPLGFWKNSSWLSSGMVMEQFKSGLISTEDKPFPPAGGRMTLFSVAPPA